MNLPVGLNDTWHVARMIETGYVLEKNGLEALLHHNETERQLAPDERVQVFLYVDKKGNLTATMQLPAITLDDYGWAEVVKQAPGLGVFVNIGTTKQILVSKDELPLVKQVWPQEGDRLYIRLAKDRKNRLLAIPATEGIIDEIRKNASADIMNQNVSGHVYLASKEGAAMITTEQYRGFIHHTERKEEPRLGQLVEGRVIDVHDDGTLNISLRPLKQHGIQDDAETILEQLKKQDGVIPFSDKSDPEDIQTTFQISKAAFKRALGKLMKEGKVKQEDGKTYLNEQ